MTTPLRIYAIAIIWVCMLLMSIKYWKFDPVCSFRQQIITYVVLFLDWVTTGYPRLMQIQADHFSADPFQSDEFVRLWTKGLNDCFNPLGAKSVQHQFSPNNISRSTRVKVMRATNLITQGRMLWSWTKFSQLFSRSPWRIWFWILRLKEFNCRRTKGADRAMKNKHR